MLLRSYCGDVYGSVLWDMTHTAIETVCVAWHKGLRCVCDLPAATDSRFITSLYELSQWKVELAFNVLNLLLNVLAARIQLSFMLLGRVFIFRDCLPQLVRMHAVVSPQLMLLFLA